MASKPPETERQYEYKTIGVNMKDSQSGDLETILNEHGDEGWELVERFDIKGTTPGVILQRQV